MLHRFSPLLDKLAIALSGLCLVHCLVGTLALAVLATGGDWLGHNVHVVGLAIALPLAVVALGRGLLRHHRIGVALLGGAGIVLMAASLAISHGGAGEVLLSVAGVGLLGFAHYRNLAAARG